MIITRFMAIALICCMVIPNVYAGVGVERGLFAKGRFSGLSGIGYNGEFLKQRGLDLE